MVRWRVKEDDSVLYHASITPLCTVPRLNKTTRCCITRQPYDSVLYHATHHPDDYATLPCVNRTTLYCTTRHPDDSILQHASTRRLCTVPRVNHTILYRRPTMHQPDDSVPYLASVRRVCTVRRFNQTILYCTTLQPDD